MRRLLLNENFPLGALPFLSGFDVVSIRTTMPGISDPEVMKLAEAEFRIIITFDKDYGDLIYKMDVQLSSSVVLIRYQPFDIPAFGKRLSGILTELDGQLIGNFWTITEDAVRYRPLPK